MPIDEGRLITEGPYLYFIKFCSFFLKVKYLEIANKSTLSNLHYYKFLTY